MLITCPECSLQVSDRARVCPHCGYPICEKNIAVAKNSKHRRLPNGFGQITELKNRNLRNPYRAMITVGKDENGRPISKLLKPISYFATYNEAYAALLEYNRSPYDLNKCISIKELYDEWLPKYTKTLKSDSSIRTITSAWAYCENIHSLNVRDLRARHIKACMDDGFVIKDGETIRPTASIKSRIKSLFNLMLDYALEYEYVDKNYSRTFSISDEIRQSIEENRKAHTTFTKEEMNLLWEKKDQVNFADIILVQCYTGWRPQEMGAIELRNVNINEWTMIGGMKTTAGKDRLVPIHSKIRPIVLKYYNEAVELGSQYLFNTPGYENLKLTYDKYSDRFNKVVKILNLSSEHRAHDPRKQFITMAKASGVDEYAIKRIVGHAIFDVTEKIYTDRDVSWLKDEIEKIG